MTNSTLAPSLADLPARTVLAVDGAGPAEAPAFGAAITGLVTVRAALGGGGVPVEGTFWQDGDPLRLDLDAPDGWRWTLAVPAPDGVDDRAVRAAAGGAGVRLLQQPARRVARLLHRGPYAEEGPSLAALHAFAAAQGLRVIGPHTETYLDDPARTPPAELRTVLDLPVA